MTTELGQTERLRAVCADMAGEHYESPAWKSASSALDWENHWPIVDANGLLTGDIYESGDPDDDYANVDNIAMVAIDDLPRDERLRIRREQDAGAWEGYANV